MKQGEILSYFDLTSDQHESNIVACCYWLNIYIKTLGDKLLVSF